MSKRTERQRSSKSANQHPREAAYQRLLKAIKAIPAEAGKPWDPRQALEMFVQHALFGLAHIHMGTDGGVDPKALQFVTVREKRVAVQEVGAAIAAYVEAVKSSRPFEDVLTQVHAELLAERGGQGLGQHFTPGDVCDLAQALATDMALRKTTSSGGTVYDCCCGSGALALAAIRSRLELIPSHQIRVRAGDIDPLCSAMTALQIHASQTFHYLPLGSVLVTVGNELVGPRKPGFWSDCTREWIATHPR